MPDQFLAWLNSWVVKPMPPMNYGSLFVIMLVCIGVGAAMTQSRAIGGAGRRMYASVRTGVKGLKRW